jgi:hypothetical protein
VTLCVIRTGRRKIDKIPIDDLLYFFVLAETWFCLVCTL